MNNKQIHKHNKKSTATIGAHTVKAAISIHTNSHEAINTHINTQQHTHHTARHTHRQ